MDTLPLKQWFTFLNLSIFIICFCTIFVLVSCETENNPCSLKRNCHECIQTPSCAWCSQPNIGDYKQCFMPSLIKDNSKHCPQKYVHDPQNFFEVNQAKQLTRSSKSKAAKNEEIVQLYPQIVTLRLRPNKIETFKFSYSRAEDFPVDLYYLMDLSASMKDDKNNLSKLGGQLATEMNNITSNFRLGFGSFVDKVAIPFVSCLPKEKDCQFLGHNDPYSFRHHMKLSSNDSVFSKEVKKAPVSINLDAPEGGLDAVMQAVVCKDEIGWRDHARRLLVYSTDETFHQAGDGRLGGIIKPNDGQCHLDNDGLYTHSLVQDYPSISHVNFKVQENAINIIFAVTSGVHGLYQELTNHIEGSYSGILSDKSENVVEFIKEQYEKITSVIEFKDNAPGALKLSYFTKCLTGGSRIQTNKCSKLKIGDKVDFDVEIELLECPVNKSQWNQSFKIYPVGINEVLTVNIEMLCDCPCENPGNEFFKENSEFCNSGGIEKCGICECDASHSGRNCECNFDNLKDNTADVTARCRPNNSSNQDCSGRGTCICGQCICSKRPDPDEIYSGPFCECNNFLCDRDKGLLCSGPDHGTCKCGHCECKLGWSGSSCNCYSRNDTCQPPDSDEMCSGHGKCVCGKCECYSEVKGPQYSGKYCEKCLTCPPICAELKDCVACKAYKKGPYTEKECKNQCTKIHEVFLVNETELVDQKHEASCSGTDNDGCKFNYLYSYNKEKKIVIEAEKELLCPAKAHIIGIVSGVTGVTILIGLLVILLWKILTVIQDKREFVKFEKQKALAKWNTDDNPLYKQPTSTFNNPAYYGD